jgi:hypothetical protein
MAWQMSPTFLSFTISLKVKRTLNFFSILFIITQKWLHFGFLASREAWSDIRRTGYPSGLAFPEVAGTITNVPNRWRYPNTEVNYNPYYKEVSAEDTYYHKLFWAK